MCGADLFGISGWVMLTRSPQRSEGAWLVQRLRRLIVPLLVWDLVFLASAWVVAEANRTMLWPKDGDPFDWLLREARVIAFGPGTAPHLWFLYYLVPLSIAIWLIQVAPRSIGQRRTLRVVGVAAAALILPYGVVGLFNATSHGRCLDGLLDTRSWVSS